jgi:hypothetical protein
MPSANGLGYISNKKRIPVHVFASEELTREEEPTRDVSKREQMACALMIALLIAGSISFVSWFVSFP